MCAVARRPGMAVSTADGGGQRFVPPLRPWLAIEQDSREVLDMLPKREVVLRRPNHLSDVRDVHAQTASTHTQQASSNGGVEQSVAYLPATASANAPEAVRPSSFSPRTLRAMSLRTHTCPCAAAPPRPLVTRLHIPSRPSCWRGAAPRSKRGMRRTATAPEATTAAPMSIPSCCCVRLRYGGAVDVCSDSGYVPLVGASRCLHSRAVSADEENAGRPPSRSHRLDRTQARTSKDHGTSVGKISSQPRTCRRQISHLSVVQFTSTMRPSTASPGTGQKLVPLSKIGLGCIDGQQGRSRAGSWVHTARRDCAVWRARWMPS